MGGADAVVDRGVAGSAIAGESRRAARGDFHTLEVVSRGARGDGAAQLSRDAALAGVVIGCRGAIDFTRRILGMERNYPVAIADCRGLFFHGRESYCSSKIRGFAKHSTACESHGTLASFS